jgi:hypothetical protein
MIRILTIPTIHLVLLSLVMIPVFLKNYERLGLLILLVLLRPKQPFGALFGRCFYAGPRFSIPPFVRANSHKTAALYFLNIGIAKNSTSQLLWKAKFQPFRL